MPSFCSKRSASCFVRRSLGGNRGNREHGDQRQGRGRSVHSPDCSKPSGLGCCACGPRRRVPARSHQQVELAALDHSSKIRNLACCRASRTSSTASWRWPELCGGAVVVLAQRLQPIADRGFVVGRLRLRAGKFPKLLQHLIVPLLIPPANLLKGLRGESTNSRVVRFGQLQRILRLDQRRRHRACAAISAGES